MEKQNSSNIAEKIDIAKERIKQLETMINHWEGRNDVNYWDIECDIRPSSPACLLFNE